MQSSIDQIKQLSIAQKATLHILRIALNGDVENNSFYVHDNKISNDNIQKYLHNETFSEIRQFARLQGLSALVFNTINSLDISLSIPRNLKIAWGLETENALRKYRHFCKIAPELEKTFSEMDMIPVYLKGLSLSLLYPHPEFREFGDFDFFLLKKDVSINKQNIRINALEGESFLESQGISVNTTYPKHSSFNFKSVNAECHRFLLNLQSIKEAWQVEKILQGHLDPSKVFLPNGKDIHIVSYEFSKIFVAFHALQHAGSGLRIRHIIDWAMLCNASGYELSELGFSNVLLKGASSLNAISNLLLGTKFTAKDDPDITARLLHAILNPSVYERINDNHKFLASYFYSLKRFTLRHKITKSIFPATTPFIPKLTRSILNKISK